MTRPTPEELRSLREDGLCARRRREFRAAARAADAWDRAHPLSVDGVLDWIDQLRDLLGEPPVDRTPWRGEDFRL